MTRHAQKPEGLPRCNRRRSRALWHSKYASEPLPPHVFHRPASPFCPHHHSTRTLSVRRLAALSVDDTDDAQLTSETSNTTYSARPNTHSPPTPPKRARQSRQQQQRDRRKSEARPPATQAAAGDCQRTHRGAAPACAAVLMEER